MEGGRPLPPNGFAALTAQRPLESSGAAAPLEMP